MSWCREQQCSSWRDVLRATGKKLAGGSGFQSRSEGRESRQQPIQHDGDCRRWAHYSLVPWATSSVVVSTAVPKCTLPFYCTFRFSEISFVLTFNTSVWVGQGSRLLVDLANDFYWLWEVFVRRHLFHIYGGSLWFTLSGNTRHWLITVV